MRDRNPVKFGKRGIAIAVRLIGNHDDTLHAFGTQLVDNFRHRQCAVYGLSAGHCDRVVEQDLVGDIDPGGDRGADRQQSRMKIGAVTEVLEHVFGFGKRRLAEPGGAFSAHLGEGFGAAIHPGRHVMAADAAVGPAALRHHGRGIVRAA